MRLFDLVNEGWVLANDTNLYTTYKKSLSSLTVKDWDLIDNGDDFYAFRSNNIPTNFIENQGEKVDLDFNISGTDVYLTIRTLREFPNSLVLRNYTHLVYRLKNTNENKKRIILRYNNVSSSDQINNIIKRIKNCDAFYILKPNNSYTFFGFKNFSANVNINNSTSGSGIIFKPILPFSYRVVTSSPTFSDTSTPYTTLTAGTYTYEMNLFTNHFMVGAFVGGSSTSQVQLKIWHEYSTNGGSTWNIAQAFSLWSGTAYITTFFLPLTINFSEIITNRRLRYQALFNLLVHYFYIIDIDQPSGEIKLA